MIVATDIADRRACSWRGSALARTSLRWRMPQFVGCALAAVLACSGSVLIVGCGGGSASSQGAASAFSGHYHGSDAKAMLTMDFVTNDAGKLAGTVGTGPHGWTVLLTGAPGMGQNDDAPGVFSGNAVYEPTGYVGQFFMVINNDGTLSASADYSGTGLWSFEGPFTRTPLP